MMNTAADADEPLDSEELLHLAARAAKADRSHDALALLKRALAMDPDNGRVLYMIGAVHASLGMVDRAIGELSQATELSPELGPAHFQLGLLHFSTGSFAAALQAWRPLDDLDADDPLRVFKTGLVLLGSDQLDAGIAELKRGLTLSEHETLNRDMQRVLERAEAALASAASMTGSDAAAQDAQHVLVARYGQV